MLKVNFIQIFLLFLKFQKYSLPSYIDLIFFTVLHPPQPSEIKYTKNDNIDELLIFRERNTLLNIIKTLTDIVDGRKKAIKFSTFKIKQKFCIACQEKVIAG